MSESRESSTLYFLSSTALIFLTPWGASKKLLSLGALKPATRGRVQNQQVNGRSVNVYSAGGYS